MKQCKEKEEENKEDCHLINNSSGFNCMERGMVECMRESREEALLHVLLIHDNIVEV